MRRARGGSASSREKQDPGREGTLVRFRGAFQPADAVGGVPDDLSRLSGVQRGRRIVVRPMPLFLKLREPSRETPDFGGVGRQGGAVQALPLGVAVLEGAIDVTPGAGMAGSAALPDQTVGGNARQAVEHCVVRRAHGATEMRLAVLLLGDAEQVERRRDEFGPLEPLRTGHSRKPRPDSRTRESETRSRRSRAGGSAY